MRSIKFPLLRTLALAIACESAHSSLSFDHDVTKCITEVRQIVKKVEVAESSKPLIHWEDLLITKKQIPSSWKVIQLN